MKQMKFKNLDHLAEWVEYSGQRDRGVNLYLRSPQPHRQTERRE